MARLLTLAMTLELGAIFVLVAVGIIVVGAD